MSDVKFLLNSASESLKDTSVDFEKFVKKLTDFFGYDSQDKLSIDDLNCLTWEDLESCSLPRGKARQIAKIFRLKEEVGDIIKKIESLATLDLIDYYDTDVHINPVANGCINRLKNLFGNQRFIVFNDDGSVDKNTTKKLLKELIEDYPERAEIFVGDDVKRTYSVGEKPIKLIDENPLFPGGILLPDHVNWLEIDKRVRQLLWLAVKETKELSGIGFTNSELDIFEKVKDKSFSEVAKRFNLKKAALLLKELESTNQAPQLKIKQVKKTNNNPFNVGGNKTW